MFALKNDGTLYFYVDHRKLIAITHRGSYPLPKMDECMDFLGDASIFSSLDADSGYWQNELEPLDCEMTAITSHIGLY